MVSKHLCRDVSVLHLNFVLDERFTHYSLYQRQLAKIQKKQQVWPTCCNFLFLELVVPRGTVK